MVAAVILDNFEWPYMYLRNGSRSTYRTYSAHRAVIFAIAQLSCYFCRFRCVISQYATATPL